ncbi:MAG: hypothetical protein JWO38_3287 [Gemmataceae bacterium]|nr:hypothetical protein [Gemmataceae bacterium]
MRNLLVCVLVAGWFLLAGAPARAQPAEVVPSAGVDRNSIRLSESARLRLALEGPAPLRVDLPAEPEKILSPEAAGAWRIRPAGAAAVTPLAEGRERWERTFRLDPWDPAEKAVITFAPVKVTAGTDLNPREVNWPAIEVRVQTTIGETKAENARPVTGIEDLPPVTPPNPAVVGWQMAAGLGSVFATMVVVVLVRRARAKPPPLPPGEWAVRELDRLDRALAAVGVTGGDAADRVAAVVREFVERRHGLPAPKLTTTELLVECEGAAWPVERTEPLREILVRCDRAKFAGDVPDAVEAGALVDTARCWIMAAGSASGGREPPE